MGDFWVFGYGSLIWRPGFAHVETRRARLHGYRRSLCVYSFVHRGTRERPGLVLGLDRGGSCIGLAFRVPGDLRNEVITYLRERELVTNVYLERTLSIRLDNDGMKDYVSSTLEHLEALGIRDHWLEEVAKRIGS
ncbi:MAG: gamma-glutamylcyclotransferase [Mesorhizobium sp.]|nr:MAG: gamma-glutamylcyclotransferase [Mesorhizobium sp.]